VYNNHPLDPKKESVVDRLLLFGGHLSNIIPNWDLKMVFIEGGRSLEVVICSSLSVLQKPKKNFSFGSQPNPTLK